MHGRHVDWPGCGLYEPAAQRVQEVSPLLLKKPGPQTLQVRLTPTPDDEKPALHVQVDAPAVLLLPKGHTVHDDAWAALKKPAEQAVQVLEPAMAKLPAVQGVHTSEAPVPDEEKPPLQMHEAAPKKLADEPAGHATHEVPLTLYVLGVHAAQTSDAPLPVPAKPAAQEQVAAP